MAHCSILENNKQASNSEVIYCNLPKEPQRQMVSCNQ